MMVEKSGRPAYLQIVDELRGQIRAGSLPPGTALPSIAQLCERFDVSASVVKAAISVLRTEGVVIGQQGKGVFVRETPAETLSRRRPRRPPRSWTSSPRCASRSRSWGIGLPLWSRRYSKSRSELLDPAGQLVHLSPHFG